MGIGGLLFFFGEEIQASGITQNKGDDESPGDISEADPPSPTTNGVGTNQTAGSGSNKNKNKQSGVMLIAPKNTVERDWAHLQIGPNGNCGG